jgi:DHA1 family inner membrane transport protein
MKLIPRHLVLLAFSTFAMGTEAFVYTGHLTALSRDLSVPVARTGALAASFSATLALSGPILTWLTRRADRKVLLWLGLIIIGLLNIGAALASNFFVLLVVRVACGLAAGLVGPSAQAAAAMLSPPHERGRAMAVVLAGMTLAFMVGAPLGSIFGASFGWRATFVFSAVLSGIASILILVLLPRVEALVDVKSDAARPMAVRRLSVPLLFTFLSAAATFSAIAYIGPLLNFLAGFDGVGVGAMQTLIGVGSILGIAFGARFADRTDWARPMTWLFTTSAVSLAVYSVLGLQRPSRPIVIIAFALSLISGAGALFARMPIIQGLIARAEPNRLPVALALNASMMSLGHAAGAAWGGLWFGTVGIVSLGFAGSGIAACGALLARSGWSSSADRNELSTGTAVNTLAP